MSIRVTCPGCHTRFNVSEKHAGKEGACPKCKATIKVPAASEQVKVHAPESFGPKGVEGKAVLKPISRQETVISPVQIVLILSTIIGFIAVAVLIRIGVSDKANFSSIVLLSLSIALAIPCVLGAYSFLRDSELGAFTGQDLWVRVIGCSVVYGLLWVAIPLAEYAVDDNFGTTSLVAGIAVMFVLGTLTAHLAFGIDITMGVLHYGMYLGCCLILRWVAGFSVLPEKEPEVDPFAPVPADPEVGDAAKSAINLILDHVQWIAHIW